MPRNKQDQGRLSQERLLSLVQSNPGIHIRRLSMLTGMSWSNCVYHLRQLDRLGHVTSRKVQGKVCWFDCRGGRVQGKEAACIIQDTVNLRLANLIINRPGQNQTTLAKSLEMAASVVHRRVTRMEDAGLLMREKHSRSSHVFPSEDLVELIANVGHPTNPQATGRKSTPPSYGRAPGSPLLAIERPSTPGLTRASGKELYAPAGATVQPSE